MHKLFNSFSVKNQIKAAGGRWNAAAKCWTVSAEQFSNLPEDVINAVTVVAPAVIVAAKSGDIFKMVKQDGEVRAITDDNKIIATFKKTTTASQRGHDSYYDVHRHAKGDHLNFEDHFEFKGNTDLIIKAIQDQLPAGFCSWKMDRVTNCNWEVYQYVQGLCVGGSAWFGNSTKSDIAKIKKAQKNSTFEVK